MFVLSIFSVYIAAKSIDITKIEKKLVYKPVNKTYNLIPVIDSRAQKNYFFSKDGIKINYLRIKGSRKFPVIVFCHGNSGNMTRCGNQSKLKFLVQEGYEVFTFDYRGFGESGGEVDEKGLYDDLNSFIAYLDEKYNIPNDKIILWGHSLGSAVVIDTASKIKLKGVIVEGAFTSVEDVRDYVTSQDINKQSLFHNIRNRFYDSIPITQKFSSKDKIASVKSPTLIIHAINDKIIPYEMGEKLAKLKPDAKTCFSKIGGHCDYGWQDKYILKFLRNLN